MRLSDFKPQRFVADRPEAVHGRTGFNFTCPACSSHYIGVFCEDPHDYETMTIEEKIGTFRPIAGCPGWLGRIVNGELIPE